MTAEQAKDFGIIDKVIKSRDEAEAMLTPAKPVQG
jgi:ATP-dependent protease ClpP protease subunit